MDFFAYEISVVSADCNIYLLIFCNCYNILKWFISYVFAVAATKGLRQETKRLLEVDWLLFVEKLL